MSDYIALVIDHKDAMGTRRYILPAILSYYERINGHIRHLLLREAEDLLEGSAFLVIHGQRLRVGNP